MLGTTTNEKHVMANANKEMLDEQVNDEVVMHLEDESEETSGSVIELICNFMTKFKRLNPFKVLAKMPISDSFKIQRQEWLEKTDEEQRWFLEELRSIGALDILVSYLKTR
jgi:hypothetical protein